MATSGLGLLASAYGDSEDEEEAPAPAPTAIVVNPAPSVMGARPDSHEGGMWNAIKTDKAKQQSLAFVVNTFEKE